MTLLARRLERAMGERELTLSEDDFLVQGMVEEFRKVPDE